MCRQDVEGWGLNEQHDAMTTNTQSPVSELNQILKESFGPGHRGSIARSPAFGHEDHCWIISGPKSEQAAKMLAAKMKGTCEKNEGDFMGQTFVSHTITFTA
jgi:hypothetical protein